METQLEGRFYRMRPEVAEGDVELYRDYNRVPFDPTGDVAAMGSDLHEDDEIAPLPDYSVDRLDWMKADEVFYVLRVRYHALRARRRSETDAQARAYQCLYVERTDPLVPADRRRGFIWSCYEGSNHVQPHTIRCRVAAGVTTANRVVSRLTSNGNVAMSCSPFIKWWPDPRRCTYDYYPGNAIALYNDASTDAQGSAGLFHDILEAIDQAQHFIFIADWAFHPRLRTTPSATQTIGEKLSQWATDHPSGIVAIHTWNHYAVKMGAKEFGAPDPQNNEGGPDLDRSRKPGVARPTNLCWRASTRTFFLYSHHQKFVVLDGPGQGNRRVVRAFVGGLDLTHGRFDWPEHPFLATDPRCQRFREVTSTRVPAPNPEVHDWYNNEFGQPPLDSSRTLVDSSSAFPRQAWHDVHSQIRGPAAWDVVREFVGRWQLDPSSKYEGAVPSIGDTGPAGMLAITQKYIDVLGNPLFDLQAVPYGGGDSNWTAQIFRSLAKEHWADPRVPPGKTKFEWKWEASPKLPEALNDPLLDAREKSIEAAYVQAIRQADRFVYIETQFFIGCGSGWLGSYPRPGVTNRVPSALLSRIKQKAPGPFHVYIVLPHFPEGDPAGIDIREQRVYQWRTIEFMIRGLQQAGLNWRRYLTIGYLANWANLAVPVVQAGERPDRARQNQRYMLYVHSKFMIVDDQYVMVGSANLNERSLNGGRDSEICVGMWPSAGREAPCHDDARAFRYRLWSEHFLEPDSATSPYWTKPAPDYWVFPEDPACSRMIQRIGAANAVLLGRGAIRSGMLEKSGHFCLWPINGSIDGLGLCERPTFVLDGFQDAEYLWPSGGALPVDAAE
jgi:phosphatidylserine/phosphatidylglycerophosphate/cardiolipin synthase-like enzyme